jgi:hypothetical protein
MVSAFLPADQGYALMKAAAAVMELHGECHQRKRRGSHISISRSLSQTTATTGTVLTTDSVELSFTASATGPPQLSDMLNQAVLADPTGTIFSVPELQLIPPRLYNEDGLTSGNCIVHRDSAFRDRTSSFVSSPGDVPGASFFGEKSAARYSGLDLRKIVVAAYAEGNPKAGAFEGTPPLSSPMPWSHPPPLLSLSLSLSLWFADTRQSKELILDVLLKSITDDITSGDTFRAKESQPSVDDEDGPPLLPSSSASASVSSSSLPLFQTSPDPKRGFPVKVSVEDTPLGEELDDTIDRQCWDESSFPVRGGGDNLSDTSSQLSVVSSSQLSLQQLHLQQQQQEAKGHTVVGADDFLPLFVFVLVSPPSLFPPPSTPL